MGRVYCRVVRTEEGSTIVSDECDLYPECVEFFDDGGVVCEFWEENEDPALFDQVDAGAESVLLNCKRFPTCPCCGGNDVKEMKDGL